MSIPKKNTDVEEALDLLSAEVREEIHRIREEGAGAMLKGDLATARSVIDFASNLETFARNVDKLVQQWNSISDQQEAEAEPVRAIVSKIFTGKARKGTITTHEELYIPLLQALENLGGSAKTKDAIDEVGRLMEGKLKPKDFDYLKSGTDTIRWRNKVMWARNNLVNELGLMRSDSSFGVWAISEAGSKYLAEQTGMTRPVTPVIQQPASPAPAPARTSPAPYSQTPGHTKGPQSNMSVTIRWDILDKGEREHVRAATAAATLVHILKRLGQVLGNGSLEQLTRFRISRGPLVSRNPGKDFVNGNTMEVYGNHLIPGTDLYVLTHSSTDQKIQDLKALLVFLKMPPALFEITKHRKS